MATVLQALALQVSQGGVPDSEEWLQVPIAALPLAQLESLLGYFLQLGSQADNQAAMRSMIDIYDLVRGDPAPLILMLSQFDKVPIELRQYAFRCYADRHPLHYFVALINCQEPELVARLMAVLPSLIPTPLTADDFRQLLSLLDEEQEDLRQFFAAQLAATKTSGSHPSWVQPGPAVSLKDYPRLPLSTEVALSNLYRRIEEMSLPDAEGRQVPGEVRQQALMSQYCVAMLPERLQLVPELAAAVTAEAVANERLILQEYGPLNSHAEGLSDCGKRWGGCRMLLCQEFADPAEDLMATDAHSQNPDWFTGHCEECQQRISARHHALRLPLLRGGWQGCYCSASCLATGVTEPAQGLAVGHIVQQIETIGIRDR